MDNKKHEIVKVKVPMTVYWVGGADTMMRESTIAEHELIYVEGEWKISRSEGWILDLVED